MAVADKIAGALQKFGRPMILRRAGQADLTVYGRSKNYQPEELLGGIVQGDSEITITNAEIAASPSPNPPKRLDKLVVDGRVRNIESVEAEYLGTEVLVFVCQVRG